MKIFLDTANVEQLKKAKSWGVIDGATTNPTLVAKEGREFKELLQEICEIVEGPVSAEVVSLDAKEMVKEAKDLAKIHENVVIKVPMIAEGLKAVRELSSMEIPTNMTLVFSANQALLAAKAGATYVSPFIGRIDDTGHVGMELVKEIVSIYLNYAFETEVIVASVRHPVHVVDAALAGAHVATVPFAVLEKMVAHPLTDKGIETFLADWKKVPK